MRKIAELRVSPIELTTSPSSVFAHLGKLAQLVWVRAGDHRFAVVNDPEIVKDVLVDQAHVLVKHSQLIEAGRSPKRLSSYAHGIPVDAFRAALAPAMRPAPTLRALDAVGEAVTEELAGWRDGHRLRLMAAMRRLALTTSLKSTLGSDLSRREQRLLATLCGWSEGGSRVSSDAVRRRELLTSVSARQRIAKRVLPWFGARLLRNRDTDVTSTLDAVAHDLPAIFASTTPALQHETAADLARGAVLPLAQTSAWSIACLAREKKATARLREEWNSVLKAEALVGREHLRELRFTEAFVREVTRFHPTNERIVRVAAVDTEIAGERVLENTRVVLNVHALHQDERYWDTPNRFAPERWLDGRPSSHKYAYLAFGIGHRRCLGEHPALVSLIALLPALARGWDFELGSLALSRGGRAQPSESTKVRLRTRRARASGLS